MSHWPRYEPGTFAIELDGTQHSLCVPLRAWQDLRVILGTCGVFVRSEPLPYPNSHFRSMAMNENCH